MMNGDCYDDQYPVNGTLDIESRVQREARRFQDAYSRIEGYGLKVRVQYS